MENQSAWHAKDKTTVLDNLRTNESQGLTESDVKNRQKQFGQNELSKSRGRSVLNILWSQLNNIVVFLLLAAALLAFLTSRYPEGFAVAAVIVVNVVIGFLSEWRAMSSMQALRKVTEPEITVRRNAITIKVAASNLVPGDIVLLEKDQPVPADMRLLTSKNLQVNEASLTGESVPVSKKSKHRSKKY